MLIWCNKLVLTNWIRTAALDNSRRVGFVDDSPENKMSKKIASLSLDLDNKWSYMKTHGDAGWETFSDIS